MAVLFRGTARSKTSVIMSLLVLLCPPPLQFLKWVYYFVLTLPGNGLYWILKLAKNIIRKEVAVWYLRWIFMDRSICLLTCVFLYKTFYFLNSPSKLPVLVVTCASLEYCWDELNFELIRRLLRTVGGSKPGTSIALGNYAHVQSCVNNWKLPANLPAKSLQLYWIELNWLESYWIQIELNELNWIKWSLSAAARFVTDH